MSYTVNFGQGPPQPQQQYLQQYQQNGYCHPNLPPPQANAHYGNYGQTFQGIYARHAWQAMAFSGEDEFYGEFMARAGQFQALQAEELMKILNEHPKVQAFFFTGGRPVHWSLELCKVMLAMLDRSKDGMMQYPEFKELLQCLVYWKECFDAYDADRSGFIEANELTRCVREKFNYVLTPKTMECLLKRYSRAVDHNRLLIALDDFISLSVRLRAYTEAFRARDRQSHGVETGKYEFGYDDFLQCTMCL